MRKPKVRLVLIPLLLAVAGLFALVNALRGPSDSAASSPRQPHPSSQNNPEIPPARSSSVAPIPAIDRNAEAHSRLQEALGSLKSSTSATNSKRILAELRAYLASLPPDLAAAVIADFLADTSADADTKIEFALGKNGSLDGQPTLRVALLDWLAHFDTQKAGAMAKRILSTPTAADEWAVCLRNYARAYPGTESNDFLRTKTEELIRNPKWRFNPSVGFFEAFDVLVHTRATTSTDLLSGLVADRTPEGKPLAHAAWLTLDRLTQREPATMIRQLAAAPDLAKVRPEMVANLVARADLRESTQQHLVRSYLLDPARTDSELNAFAGVYPNANFAISNNLLTDTATPTGAELAAHDAAALAIITTWQADPAFASIKSHLDTMLFRLRQFTGQKTQNITPTTQDEDDRR
jgi:hypothetical protein